MCVGHNERIILFDFYINTGKTTEKFDSGLSHDVVMQLVPPLAFQGYELYCDNYYSSSVLSEDLHWHGTMATGSFHTSRRGLPSEVVSLKHALIKGKVPCGTGYILSKRGNRYCLLHEEGHLCSVCDATLSPRALKWKYGIQELPWFSW